MAAPDALLETLNPDQRAAVIHGDGPLRVIAGAGTGKTRVLVARIAWLVTTGRARPEQICALAFMNDAAGQIERRLRDVLGSDAARRVWAGTSHRLAAHLLRSEAERFGRHARFSIWDERDVDAALQVAVGAGTANGPGATGPSASRARVRAHARARAERLRPPHADVEPGEGEGEAENVGAALAAYERAKRVSSAFDFDDLLRYAVVALESDDALRVRWGRRFAHVLVDEFQDLNPAQYRLAALLASDHRRLTVLGDPRQAICAYRGATSAENFAAFAAEFADAATVRLACNYRSTAPVLAAANRLAGDTHDGTATALWTPAPGGDEIVVVACDDDEAELARIVAWARRDVRDTRAVLVRVNAQVGAIEQALLAAGLPVTVFGATPFAARAEIRDALAALSLVANPRDRLAFARVAAAAGRGVGPGACRALFTRADAHPDRSLLALGAAGGGIAGLTARQRNALRALCAPLLDAHRALATRPEAVRGHVLAVLVASGQPDRLTRTAGGTASATTRWRARRQLANLRALVNHARAFEHRAPEPRMSDFLAELALAGDERRVAAHAVVLATIHRAKGLEFDHVWIAGAEEGRLPHRRSVRDGQEAEERRLAYVAVTRARRTLHVSWAARRAGRRREPSRYLAPIRGTATR
jgi:DNA helicase-2/ATP-dependent DNA helicase PcrA